MNHITTVYKNQFVPYRKSFAKFPNGNHFGQRVTLQAPLYSKIFHNLYSKWTWKS